MKRKWLKWVMTVTGALALWVAMGGVSFAQEAVDEISRSINTVWVMLASFLVFFMQAGFAALEAGSTRAKNTINILMKNLLDFCFATFAFWAVGFAFMFGEGTSIIGLQGFFLSGFDWNSTDDIPLLATWLFQLVFAGTAATIVSGAMAERTQFKSYLIYSVIITAFIYPIFGHWVWGGGWLSTLPFGDGFSDFAGSTVVHSVGGWAALMGAIVVGPRIGRFDKDGKSTPIPGHSLPLMALGVFILWLGWFGFNPGSQLAAATNDDANAIALVAATTNIAAAMGAVGALLLGWALKGKADLSLALNGVVGGLVAITAPCAVVTPFSAAIIGLIGGGIVVLGMGLLESLKIDDPVGAVPAHLMAGMWGTIALGLFSTEAGLFMGYGPGQLIAQIIGVVACGVWTGGTAFLLFFALKSTVGLRISAEEEELGLDVIEHGATAYGTPMPQLPSSATPEASAGMGRAPAQ